MDHPSDDVGGAPEPQRFELSSGRILAFDLVDGGGPADRPTSGAPVLVVHGTPDSRLATPPDAQVGGVTQIVVDRPGFGDSDPHPEATPASVADDLAELCAGLGHERVGVMAWSAGALFATAMAARHPDLVRRLVLAAPLAPADAWEETAPDRYRFVADDVAFIVEFLVPVGIDLEGAIQLALGDSEERRGEVESVPGAAERLGRAVMASVRSGNEGLQRDLLAQLEPIELSGIDAPCHIVVGEHDTTCPPAMGRWLADRMTGSEVTVEQVPGAGHAFPLVRWGPLIRAATDGPHDGAGRARLDAW